MAVSNSTDRFNGIIASKAIKVPCKRAATTNIASLSGPLFLDFYNFNDGDRVLLTAQTNPVENGIWEVNTSSAWSRAPDWDGSRDITLNTLVTAERSSGVPVMYRVSSPATDPIVVGSTPVLLDFYFDPDNPAAADLQTVTDVGNTTTNPIQITNGSALILTEGTGRTLTMEATTNPINFTVSGAASGIQFLGAATEYFFSNDVRVAGNVTAQQNGIFVGFNSTGAESIQMSHNDTDGIISASLGYLRLQPATAVIIPDGSSSQAGIGFDGEEGMGMYRHQPNMIAWTVASARRMSLSLGGLIVHDNFMSVNDGTQSIYLNSDDLGSAILGTTGRTNLQVNGVGLDYFTLREPNFRMLEKAAAPADQAGFGQVWVRNDVPNTLMFTDDDGNDYVVGGQAFGDPLIVTRLIAGDPGTESTGISIDGVNYLGSAKVSDLGGTNLAQFILHRHSTTIAPVIVSARSNSDDATHALVTDGQSLLWITATGWDGAAYQRAAEIELEVDGTAALNDMPGRVIFSTTPAGAKVPVERMRISSEGSLYLSEIAAADTDIVGKGQLWVNSADAGLLYFTDEAGNDYSLTAGGGGGFDSFNYVYDSTTTINDPGPGNIRFNNAGGPGSSQQFAIDTTDSDGTDLYQWMLDCWGPTNGAVNGILFRIVKADDPTVYAYGSINETATISAGYVAAYINWTETNGTFTNGDACKVQITPQPYVAPPTTAFGIYVGREDIGGQPLNGVLQSSLITHPLNVGTATLNFIQGGTYSITMNAGSVTTSGAAICRHNASNRHEWYGSGNILPRLQVTETSVVIGHGNDAGNGAPQLYLRERTSLTAPGTGWGGLAVLNSTPNQLWFIDDANNTYNLTNPGAAATVISAGWSTGSGGSFTVGANAPFFYTEQAANDTPAAGQGQVWVRNDTPNTLMFTDDAGGDHPLSIIFTSTENGLAPASGGGTTNFLRADGTWAAPPGGGITQLTGDVTAGPGSGSQAATIANDAVTYAKMQNVVGNNVLLGNNAGAGGIVDELTGTEVTALLDQFTTTLQGLVPGSGGGTTNFLRADGTWAAPAAGGSIGGSITDNQIAVGAAAANDIEGSANFTYDGTTLAIATGILPSAPAIEVSNTRPVIVLDESDATADNGRWYLHASAETFEIVAINDANTVSDPAITINRTGAAIDNLIFGAPLQAPTGSAAAPGIVFSSATTTGFYNVTTNTIGFAGGGVALWQANNNAMTFLTGKDLIMEDNSEIQLGTAGADGRIYSDGTNVIIQHLVGGGDILLNTATSGLVAIQEGGSTKFEVNHGSDRVIINDYTLYLEERAAAQGDTAAYGQLWVRNDTPNSLMFTDDAGNDIVLASQGNPAGIQGDFNTGSLTLTGTTFAGALNLGLPVSSTFMLYIVFDCQAPSADDVKIQFATNAGTVVNGMVTESNTNTSQPIWATAAQVVTNSVVIPTNGGANSQGSGTYVTIMALVKTDANPHTFSLRAAKNGTSGGNGFFRIHAGMMAIQIP
ncbi:MAG: hypothetical protein AMJ84_00230 [Acidithiobacillales bacterium SM23_46]|nr:MAG: hypothetical protein AMJ84_00230 [Acidithiobacillales bacterium SM23_46]KPL29017.1 MAG: hypothetical protein AMJ72_00220 [Acidithiobacillales bacterium SM1_46]